MFGSCSTGRLKNTPDILLMAQHLPQPPEHFPPLDKYERGSRDDVLKRILAWMDEPTGPAALWIQASAGMGKSTLARFLDEHLQSESRNQTTAAVFLGTCFEQSMSVDRMVKMIAHQIGLTFLPARRKIVEVLRSRQGLSEHLPQLIEQCIVEPLRAVNSHNAAFRRPFIIIIDALDEWAPHGQLVNELAQLKYDPLMLRFVLLSRHPIDHDINPKSIARETYAEVQTNAIEAYLATKFEHIATPGGTKELDDRDAERLAPMAHGHFLWASVAAALLSQEVPKRSRKQVLDEIIASQQDTINQCSSETRLKALYKLAIQIFFPIPQERSLLDEYIRFALILQEPVSIHDGARLLSSLNVNDVIWVQSKLTSFHTRQYPHLHQICPARMVFHPSFIEYLESLDLGQRSHNFAWHERIGLGCLEMLANGDLHNLPPYIIKYWPLHAARGSPSVEPGSDTAWKASSICRALQKVPRLGLSAWAQRFMQLVSPTSKPQDWYDSVESVGELISSLLCESWVARTEFEIPLLELAIRMQPDDWKVWRQLGWVRYNQPSFRDEPERCASLVRAQEFAVVTGTGLPPATRADLLRGLGSALLLRFEQGGHLEDLVLCIKNRQTVLKLLSPKQPGRERDLIYLAVLLERRLELGSGVDELAVLIDAHREVLSLRPPGHPGRDIFLVNLASKLKDRYDQYGDFRDLTEADCLSEEAIRYQSPRHPKRGEYLSVALAIQSRMESGLGRISNLVQRLRMCREILSLTPPGDERRTMALRNLAATLTSQFVLQQVVDNLAEAIALHQEALDLCPPGHSLRAPCLVGLSSALLVRFEHTGTIGDLDTADTMHEEAIALLSPGHAYHDEVVLGSIRALQCRFSHDGVVEHITKSIPMIVEVLDLHALGYTRRPDLLNSLAWRLALCFDTQAKNVEYTIQQAVLIIEEARDLKGTLGDPFLRKHLLNTHARCLRHIPGRLDEALAIALEALEANDGSASAGARRDRWVYLQTLSMVLLSLHRLRPEKEEYRDEGVIACRAGLDSCPQHFTHERSVLLEVECELNRPRFIKPTEE